MFSDMDDMDGVDPYELRDLQSAPAGGGMGATQDEMLDYYAKSIQASRTGAQQPSVPGATPAPAPAAPSTPWWQYVGGAFSAIGKGFTAKGQADVMAEASKIQGLAQKGLINQQQYQQMSQLLQARAQQLAQAPQPTFWDKNRNVILTLVALAAVGGVGYFFWKKSKRRR